jgi:peptide/nickel transport system permease protein
MSTEAKYEIEAGPVKHISEFSRFVRVFLSRGLVIFGMVIIILVVITAIFSPLIAPYDPYKQNLSMALQPPSAEHLLGTDGNGRDTLSRIIYGSRIALLVGIIATGIAALSGMTLGLIAGYFGGTINMIIMRFIDALMSFPMLVLALLIAATLGPGIRNLMIALGFSMMSGYARVMTGLVYSVKENDYIMSGRSIGAGNLRLMIRHILPNCFPPFIVMMTMQMGMAIMAEAGMSFLGIGIEAPTASWGGMVNDGYQYLIMDPVLSVAPGVAILLLVFAFNMVGDGLRDALDPRLRGAL